MQFFELRRKGDKPVFVNPELVRWLVQYGEYVTIHFDENDTVTVIGDLGHIAGELAAASKR